jgi:hypothetical protein
VPASEVPNVPVLLEMIALGIDTARAPPSQAGADADAGADESDAVPARTTRA